MDWNGIAMCCTVARRSTVRIGRGCNGRGRWSTASDPSARFKATFRRKVGAREWHVRPRQACFPSPWEATRLYRLTHHRSTVSRSPRTRTPPYPIDPRHPSPKRSAVSRIYPVHTCHLFAIGVEEIHPTDGSGFVLRVSGFKLRSRPRFLPF
eukprot:scaffold73_cov337-Pavlova_lutheri.AAC.67